jgi:hypothetical protein
MDARSDVLNFGVCSGTQQQRRPIVGPQGSERQVRLATRAVLSRKSMTQDTWLSTVI